MNTIQGLDGLTHGCKYEGVGMAGKGFGGLSENIHVHSNNAHMHVAAVLFPQKRAAWPVVVGLV